MAPVISPKQTAKQAKGPVTALDLVAAYKSKAHLDNARRKLLSDFQDSPGATRLTNAIENGISDYLSAQRRRPNLADPALAEQILHDLDYYSHLFEDVAKEWTAGLKDSITDHVSTLWDDLHAAPTTLPPAPAVPQPVSKPEPSVGKNRNDTSKSLDYLAKIEALKEVHKKAAAEKAAADQAAREAAALKAAEEEAKRLEAEQEARAKETEARKLQAEAEAAQNALNEKEDQIMAEPDSNTVEENTVNDISMDAVSSPVKLDDPIIEGASTILEPAPVQEEDLPRPSSPLSNLSSPLSSVHGDSDTETRTRTKTKTKGKRGSTEKPSLVCKDCHKSYARVDTLKRHVDKFQGSCPGSNKSKQEDDENIVSYGSNL